MASSPENAIDFSSLEMESHVERAVQVAIALSGPEPVRARNLLEGAVIAGGEGASAAFRTLTLMLEKADIRSVRISDYPPLEREGPVAVSRAVARSFVLLTERLEGRRVWGRDLVAAALLTEGEAALEELGEEIHRSVDDLRDEWFRFVSTDPGRRSVEWWVELWAAAGVPTPEERSARAEVEQKAEGPAQQKVQGTPEPKMGPGSSSPSASEVEAGPEGGLGAEGEVEVDGAFQRDAPAYLFTWNPDLEKWSGLERRLEEIASAGFAQSPWSTGNRRSVQMGARVFMMRQSVEPRGIVGSGVVAGEIEEAPHWLPEERKKGRTFHRVSVRWDTLSREPLLTRDQLKSEVADIPLWDSGAGGVAIEPDVLERLESVWQEARLGAGFEPEDLEKVGLVDEAEAVEETQEVEEADELGAKGTEDAGEVEEAPGGGAAEAGSAVGDSTLVGEPEGLPVRQTDFSSDSDTGTDLLDTRREVQTLAAIMAAEAVTPPLSIGLFGPWGSGKSFFMNLLKNEVRRLERFGPPYCRRVVQISFNAWHYIDSNLWASLANEVFEQLGREVEAGFDGGEGASDVAERRKERVRLLMATRRSRNELEEAERRRNELDGELRSARSELEGLEDDKWFFTSPSGASQRIADEALRRFMAETEIRQQLDAALSQLGLTRGDVSPRTLREQLTRLQGRFRGVKRWMAAFESADLERWTLTVVLAGAAVLAVRLAPMVDGWLQDVATAATAIAGFLAPHFRTAEKIKNEVQPVAEQFVAFAKESQGRLEEESESRLEEVEQQYDRAKARADDARQRLLQAEQELTDLLSDDRILEFVRNRQRSEVYRQHLGVIAQARQDFEYLSLLLQPETNHDGEPITPRAKELEQELDHYRRDAPTIDRIVLYIDDLDRCPEDKVVEVLQAVHLLLAFKLFVVVVGVDPRWLLHSLAERSDVFHRAGGRPGAERVDGLSDRRGGRHWRSTPMDYLEKIFQIPFHLRPMGETGFRNLVEELTRPKAGVAGGRKDGGGAEDDGASADGDGSTASEGEGHEGAAGAVEELLAEVAAAAEGAAAGLGLGDEAAGPEGPDIPDADETGGAVEAGAVVDREGGAELASTEDGLSQNVEDGVAPLEGGEEPPIEGQGEGDTGSESDGDEADDEPPPRPRLDIAGWERRFMSALHPFIGSPRTTKRFINVYRVVRSAHLEVELADGAEGTGDAEGGEAVIQEDASHRHVLFLLGMLTGFPGPSIELFRGIVNAPGGTWSDLLDRWKSRIEDRDATAREVLAKPPSGQVDEARIRREASLEVGEVAAHRELLWAIERVTRELHEVSVTFDPTLEELATWIPKVSRYSFRSGQDLRTERRVKTAGAARPEGAGSEESGGAAGS